MLTRELKAEVPSKVVKDENVAVVSTVKAPLMSTGPEASNREVVVKVPSISRLPLKSQAPVMASFWLLLVILELA